MKDILKELGINHNNTKIRKSKEQRAKEKTKRAAERRSFLNEEVNRFNTLDGLKNEVWLLIYNNTLDIETNFQTLNELYENEDFEMLQQILKNGITELKLYQDKQSIIKFLGTDNEDIRDILSKIKTIYESDLVLEALIGTEHITLLEKGYCEAKKNKMKSRHKQYKILVYEQALRRNRHLLEVDLKEMGVGQQRAQKISQILQYL